MEKKMRKGLSDKNPTKDFSCFRVNMAPSLEGSSRKDQRVSETARVRNLIREKFIFYFVIKLLIISVTESWRGTGL